MKVIDLLNKIVNNEKVPNKVKYGPYYQEYDEENKDYQDNDDDYVFSCSNYDIIDMLNKDVEIIEEPQKHKIPERLDNRYYDKVNKCYSGFKELKQEELVDKINEILDYLEVQIER